MTGKGHILNAAASFTPLPPGAGLGVRANPKRRLELCAHPTSLSKAWPAGVGGAGGRIPGPARHRRGVVLVMVMVLAMLATLMAATLMYRVHGETAAGVADARGEQAYAVAMSGVQAAIMVIIESRGDPELWYDNPQLFHHVKVAEEGRERWYFTIFAAGGEDEAPWRYGVVDESGRISINHFDEQALEQMLRELPGMNTVMVDSLLDYRDADHDPRPEGAEQDYYDRLPHPYRIANGPLATVEELLLVRGFTGEAVYGRDRLMSRMRPEALADDRIGIDFDDAARRGLAAYLTAFSYGPNVDSDNRPRVNINGPAVALQAAGLSEATIEFIALARGDGVQFNHAADLLDAEHTLESRPRGRRDLNSGTVIRSHVDEFELELVMDRLTASPQRAHFGLININTAPMAVLAAIPGIEADVAERIVATRSGLDAASRRTTAWLYTHDLLDAATFKQVAPHVAARGYQYRIRCVGYAMPSGRYRVIEAVVDLGRGSPRIIYQRDLTRLGLPFALEGDAEVVR